MPKSATKLLEGLGGKKVDSSVIKEEIKEAPELVLPEAEERFGEVTDIRPEGGASDILSRVGGRRVPSEIIAEAIEKGPPVPESFYEERTALGEIGKGYEFAFAGPTRALATGTLRGEPIEALKRHYEGVETPTGAEFVEEIPGVERLLTPKGIRAAGVAAELALDPFNAVALYGIGSRQAGRIVSEYGPTALNHLNKVFKTVGTKSYKGGGKLGQLLSVKKFDDDFIEAILRLDPDDLKDVEKARKLVGKQIDAPRLATEARYRKITGLQEIQTDRMSDLRRIEDQMLKFKKGSKDRKLLNLEKKSLEKEINKTNSKLKELRSETKINLKQLEKDAPKTPSGESIYRVYPRTGEPGVQLTKNFSINPEIEAAYADLVSAAVTRGVQNTKRFKDFEFNMSRIIANKQSSVAETHDVINSLDSMLYYDATGKERAIAPVMRKEFFTMRKKLDTLLENNEPVFKGLQQRYSTLKGATIDLRKDAGLKEFARAGKDLALGMSALKNFGVGTVHLGSGNVVSAGSHYLTSAGSVAAIVASSPGAYRQVARYGKLAGLHMDTVFSLMESGVANLGNWMAANPGKAALLMESALFAAKLESKTHLEMEYGITSLDDDFRIKNPIDRINYAEAVGAKLKKRDIGSVRASEIMKDVLINGSLYDPDDLLEE